jgi:dTDP-4-amino-4,6-dideoxygalactose transaminase
MNIPRTIPLLKVHMTEKAVQPLVETLMSGFITEGAKVKAFEKSVSDYLDNPNLIATSSCTGAIQIALKMAGVGIGSEVITTAMTCQATNQPILEAGADIIWSDVQPKTGNIDPMDIKKKITAKTKAIVMMHWAGQPCDIDEILDLAAARKIAVIEDAASAFGAEYKGRKIGTHSDFVCFSFGAVKHITTGDGGILTMKYPEIVERAYLLKNQGNNKYAKRTETQWDFDISEPGWKLSMNDVAATLGLSQMEYQNDLLEKRLFNALFYDTYLKDIEGLQILERKTDRKSACWIYTLLVDRKEDFVKKMKENGIQTSIVHQRNDLHSLYSKSKTELPNLDVFYKSMINIPVGWWLNSEDLEFIVSTIKKGW